MTFELSQIEPQHSRHITSVYYTKDTVIHISAKEWKIANIQGVWKWFPKEFAPWGLRRGWLAFGSLDHSTCPYRRQQWSLILQSSGTLLSHNSLQKKKSKVASQWHLTALLVFMDIFGQVPQICAHPPGLMFPNVILLAEGKASLFAHWSQWDAVPQGEFYQNKLRWRRHWIPHHFPCPLSSSSQSHSVSGLHFCISILLLMCLVKSFISQDSNTDGL